MDKKKSYRQKTTIGFKKKTTERNRTDRFKFYMMKRTYIALFRYYFMEFITFKLEDRNNVDIFKNLNTKYQ